MAEQRTSPGNAHEPSRLCPPHLRPCLPVTYRALKITAFSPGMAASYAVSVRQASALPAASFRFRLAADTLAVRLAVPRDGPAEDLHLQVRAPCRAHDVEKSPAVRAFSLMCFRSCPGRGIPIQKPLHGYPPSVGTAHTPVKGKEGISHGASVFDHACRADTRPLAGYSGQLRVDPVSVPPDTGSKT